MIRGNVREPPAHKPLEDGQSLPGQHQDVIVV